MMDNGGLSVADALALGRDNNGMFGGEGGAWIFFLFFLLAWGGWNGNGTGALRGGVQDSYVLASDFANIERKIDGVNNGLCDGFYAMNTGMLNGFAGVNNAVCTLGYQNAQLINGLQNTVQQGNNATQVAMMQGFNGVQAGQNAIQTQIASCCCDMGRQIERGFADTNYAIASQDCQTRQVVQDVGRAIMDNCNANNKAVMDFLVNSKIEDLQAENSALKLAASQERQNNYLISELRPLAKPSYITCNPYTGQYGSYGQCGCNSGCGC